MPSSTDGAGCTKALQDYPVMGHWVESQGGQFQKEGDAEWGDSPHPNLLSTALRGPPFGFENIMILEQFWNYFDSLINFM